MTQHDWPTTVDLLYMVLGIAIAARIVVHQVDKWRIRHEAMGRGCTHVRIKWAAFPPGWPLENEGRHYRVSFTERDGTPGIRVVKTRLWGPLYWTD